MSQLDKNLALAPQHSIELNVSQKMGLALGFVGLFILTLAFLNVSFPNKSIWLTVSITSLLVGIVLFANGKYLSRLAGISNNGVFSKSISNRGIVAWSIGIVLTMFYIALYWFPKYLGLGENGEKNSGVCPSE